MGLLDGNLDYQTVLGLGLLGQAGPQLGPRNTGAGLLNAFQMAQGWKNSEEARKAKEQEQKLKEMLMNAQIEDMSAQSQQRAAQAADLQRKASEQQRVQDLLKATFMPISGAQANQASGISGPTPAAASVIGQQPRANYQQLIAQGVPPELVQKLAESRNYGRDKVARTVKGVGPDGREYEYQVDEYGNKVGDGMAQYRSPIQVNQGNRTTFADPYNLAPMGSYQTFQSPDSAASNQLGWANYGLSKQRLAQEQAGGQLVETPNGYVRVGKDNTAMPIQAPGGGPLMGKGSGMTEDQGKATGWLIQAQNAYKNMQTAMKSTPGAERPGLNDVLERFSNTGPSSGIGSSIANAMRGDDRQKFLQATSSLGEALLRAATGAGINKDEAAQKARELSPQLLESDASIKQKMDAIPLYIESLKVRAGPGAKSPVVVGQQGNVGRFLGFEN